jgi:hypothetical protein
MKQRTETTGYRGVVLSLIINKMEAIMLTGC